jgi:hypothetical protein
MRVEIEDIEAHLGALPTVEQCVVDLRGVGETAALIAYVVLRGAGDPGVVGCGWSDSEARQALQAVLPRHMVPSAFIVMKELPHTSSGKVDRKRLPEPGSAVATAVAAAGEGTEGRKVPEVDGKALRGIAMAGGGELGARAFFELEGVQGLRRMGLDSLGLVRLYHSLVASAAEAEWEAGVANAVRGVCMFGVAVDHILACNPLSPCSAISRLVLLPQAAAAAVAGEAPNSSLQVLEALMRSVGNYKTVAGFAMVSAYLDSGAGPAAGAAFSQVDMAVFLVYMLMTWVFDPIATAIAGSRGVDTSNPWWLAAHRWYLLAMLYTRATMTLLRALRLPPAVQTGLAILAALLAPPGLACISSVCAGSPSNAESWMDWSSAPEPFNFFFLVFYRGTEPQYVNANWAPSFKYVLPRKYLFVILIYVATFHYGRPFARALRSASRNLLTTAGGGTIAAVSLRALTAASCGGALVAIALGETAAWRANEDWWVQELGPVLYGQEPALTRFGLVVVAVMTQVALLAGFFAALPGPIPALSFAGAHTLGSYMAHSYLNLAFALTVLPRLPSVEPYAALAALMALPLSILLVVGPLVQRTTLAAFTGCAAISSRLLRRVGFCSEPDDQAQTTDGKVASF